MTFTILVTGGAGYVGSHTILEILRSGYDVICVDNLVNAYNAEGSKMPESLRRVEELTNRNITFYNVDLQNRDSLRAIFRKVSIQFTKKILHTLDQLRRNTSSIQTLQQLYFNSVLCQVQ